MSHIALYLDKTALFGRCGRDCHWGKH